MLEEDTWFEISTGGHTDEIYSKHKGWEGCAGSSNVSKQIAIAKFGLYESTIFVLLLKGGLFVLIAL